MNFLGTYSRLLKFFSFVGILMIEGNEQCALQKNPVIAALVEQLKTIALRKFNW